MCPAFTYPRPDQMRIDVANQFTLWAVHHNSRFLLYALAPTQGLTRRILLVRRGVLRILRVLEDDVFHM